MPYASVVQDVFGDGDQNNFYYHEMKDLNQSFEREEQALCFGFIIGRCWIDEHLSHTAAKSKAIYARCAVLLLLSMQLPGRMEFGPRALGNRSIVVDPRRAEMKDVVNSRIKRREPFRPFAPSILLERVGNHFEETHPSPFMLMAYKVKPEKRSVIPAPTHVDGSGRLQTVNASMNPRYHQLISDFHKLTGVPVVLNTSFNENEPIVCTPQHALQCFLKTRMDVLYLGNYAVRQRSGERAVK